ncbi:MAG: ABC transporter permease [Deltaproteobacteria bacterium]|nr:ABC transporter permease [Deltaproteobacteria bacterium]
MSRHLLQIAWRNLWRNPRRTLITVAAIALGYAMLLVFACLLAGLRSQMTENGTQFGLCHMQVHAPDYSPDRSIYKTLGGQEGVDVAKLLATVTADARVRAAAPRVYGYGLVSQAYHSAGAEILGVVPGQEQQVSALHTRLVQGSYLSEQTPKGVVIGDKLANTLKATVGSEIILMTQAVDGSMGNDLYTVIGIVHTGQEAIDRGRVLMSLPASQELLNLAPTRIHEVGVLLFDAGEATTVARALEAQVSKILPVRVRAWPELSPELAEYVRLNQSGTAVLAFIVFLVAMIGVTNTMLMAVFERTRELGVLMALGMRPALVVGLVLIEAGSLVVASLIFGGTLGTPLLWYLQIHGLDLRRFIGELSIVGVSVDPIWYGRQDFAAYGRTALGLTVAALFSALYPAVRASRFRPVEAMKRV